MSKVVAAVLIACVVLAGVIAFGIFYMTAPKPAKTDAALYVGGHFNGLENCVLVGHELKGDVTCTGASASVSISQTGSSFSYLLTPKGFPRACMKATITRINQDPLSKEPLAQQSDAFICYSKAPGQK